MSLGRTSMLSLSLQHVIAEEMLSNLVLLIFLLLPNTQPCSQGRIKGRGGEGALAPGHLPI